MQLLIVYSVNSLLVVTAFSELAQYFQYFLQMIVASFNISRDLCFHFFIPNFV